LNEQGWRLLFGGVIVVMTWVGFWLGWLQLHAYLILPTQWFLLHCLGDALEVVRCSCVTSDTQR
jgi:hypothetical protein